MKKLIATAALSLITLAGYAQAPWDGLISTYSTELFIDSANVKYEEGKVYARVKTVYITPEGRDSYVNKIKKVFKKDADKKIKKWEDFQYTVTYGIYDCSNSRFKILEIEDFDSNGKRIVKTKKKEDKAVWLNADLETVGDYIVFSVCDYESRNGGSNR